MSPSSSMRHGTGPTHDSLQANHTKNQRIYEDETMQEEEKMKVNKQKKASGDKK